MVAQKSNALPNSHIIVLNRNKACQYDKVS